MRPLNDDDRRELRDVFLRRGQVVALALLRRKTGAGLQEAGETLESLVGGTDGPAPPRELLEHAVAYVLMGGDSSDLSGARGELDVGGHWTRAQRDEALRRARLLYDCAWRLCDEHRNGKRSYKSIVVELRSACPGFRDDAYEKMRERGMVDTR